MLHNIDKLQGSSVFTWHLRPARAEATGLWIWIWIAFSSSFTQDYEQRRREMAAWTEMAARTETAARAEMAARNEMAASVFSFSAPIFSQFLTSGQGGYSSSWFAGETTTCRIHVPCMQ